MLTVAGVERAEGVVRLVGDGGAGLRLARHWEGGVCRARLEHRGRTPVAVREVVLAAGPLRAGPETGLYGEGFQMLSQTGGTLGAPVAIGRYTDAGHYRLPEAAGATTVYGFALLRPEEGTGAEQVLLGFASCHRFSGAVRLFPDRFELVLDAEGLTISPGEAWDLEEALVLTGPDREALLAPLAGRIARHHPRLPWAGVPTGWCSWYWYGPGVSEADITANLRAIAATGAGLRYVQVDDGYQPHMGDWLETGPRFPGGMRDLCARIKDAGFEPAVWVAPFIAERGSRLAREHPDWLVQEGATGTPLLSSDVSFGGWRNGPWYALDGTHPGALAYLESVFATMRREWDCHYFKLDALYWGALHGGSRHDRGATRVEAYRRGMAAVRAGAGPDSFLLGCNAPMWASLGAVHGMRVSNDVARAWDRLVEVAREAFARSWQHGRLWVNDPDCLILINRPSGSPPRPSLPGSPAGSPPTRPPLTGDELRFHASAILASGGMVLAGDDTTALAEEDWRTLGRLVPPLGVAARFAGNPDGAGDVLEGVIDLPGRRLVCRFNPSDAPVSTALPRLPWPGRVADFWSGGPVGTSVTLPRHGARVLECTPRPAG